MVLEVTSGGQMLWSMAASKTIASMLSSLDGVQMATLWVVVMGNDVKGNFHRSMLLISPINVVVEEFDDESPSARSCCCRSCLMWQRGQLMIPLCSGSNGMMLLMPALLGKLLPVPFSMLMCCRCCCHSCH